MEAAHEPLQGWIARSPAEQLQRAAAFHADMTRRRTVRDFDPTQQVAREVIEHCLLAAGRAPSGANQQPWFFSVITQPEHKRQLREAAEAEERAPERDRVRQEHVLRVDERRRDEPHAKDEVRQPDRARAEERSTCRLGPQHELHEGKRRRAAEELDEPATTTTFGSARSSTCCQPQCRHRAVVSARPLDTVVAARTVCVLVRTVRAPQRGQAE